MLSFQELGKKLVKAGRLKARPLNQNYIRRSRQASIRDLADQWAGRARVRPAPPGHKEAEQQACMRKLRYLLKEMLENNSR